MPQKVELLGYIIPLITWVYLHSFFVVLRMFCEIVECVTAVQDHPRSLILAPIEKAWRLPINH